MPSSGSLTLGDVAAKTDVLAVACTRCDRTGRYPLAALIEKHVPAYTIPTLLHERLRQAGFDQCV